MILLDVSFGIFAFMPLGWLFMALLITIECFVMTRMLVSKFFDKRIFIVTSLGNIISGVIGIMISIVMNGGWWLIVWFPWVSKHEVDLSSRGEWHALIVYYLLAFILTLIIEAAINIPLLRQRYAVKKIIKATLIANALSYVAGSAILYSVSFYTSV